MTDQPETLASYRLPWRRDQLKQRRLLARDARPAGNGPLFLLGAAIVGVAGYFAWRNRERIASTTGPILSDAKVKGQALLDEARTKGGELFEHAKAAGGEVVAKARQRRTDARDSTTPELH